jgi:hypothetical protein
MRINSTKTAGDDPSLIEEIDPAKAESNVAPLKKTGRQRWLF